jgi:D-lactate dehydrogenase (cytochrome)
MTAQATAGIADRLGSVVGSDHVVTDEAKRDYFSRDLSFEPYEVAEVVVAPGSVEELRAVVREAHAAGLATVARGGGMSYTLGYAPSRSATVLIDMRRLNAIREINVQDGYVTVECGCTWEQLYTALREQGVRTPYYGPLSGRYATVGGALAQNSVFWGAARYGMVADAVLALEVVVGGGRVVRTGTAARLGASPHFRWFGPDLTGLFLSDTGALGIKAVATLKLVQSPEHTLHHSISVPDFETAIDCMEATGRLGIATEIYNLDPFYADTLVQAGLTFLADHPWSVHFTVDGAGEELAQAGMAKIREVAARFGPDIDPTTPAVFRSDPFGAVQSVLLGPKGQIWLPVHAIVPFSRAKQAARAVKAFQDENRATFDRHGIEMSYLSLPSGNDFLFEPSLYYFDELGQFRLERISPEAAREWQSIGADAAARADVLALRRKLAKVFDDAGGTHIQLARYYEYRSMLEPESFALVEGVKRLVDPDGLLNPGSLGL